MALLLTLAARDVYLRGGARRRRDTAAALGTGPGAGHLVVILAALFALTSCQGSAPNTAPYGAEFQQAQHDATSEFERQVLAGGSITRSEYEEAVQRYVACGRAKGIAISATAQTSGLYQYEVPGPPLSSAAEDVLTNCATGTTKLIEPLYSDIQQNPKHVDIFDSMAGCMVRAGKAPSNFSGTELRTLMSDTPNGHLLANGSVVDGTDAVVLKCMKPPYD